MKPSAFGEHISVEGLHEIMNFTETYKIKSLTFKLEKGECISKGPVV